MCLVDHTSRRMQDYLSNCILSSQYMQEDVLGLPDPVDNYVRDEDWHLNLLSRLGDAICDLLDNADTVPAYLNSPRFPLEFKPKQLIDTEETKLEVENYESDFDFFAYFKQLPKNLKFIRFGSLPKDIVCAHVKNGIPFYLENDRDFRSRGKDSFKFAI